MLIFDFIHSLSVSYDEAPTKGLQKKNEAPW
jgi:hypothetical protein